MRIVVIGDEEHTHGIDDFAADAEVVYADNADAAMKMVKDNFIDVLMLQGGLPKIHTITGILKIMPKPVLLILTGSAQHYYLMGNNKLHISSNCHIPVKEEGTAGQDTGHYASNF